MGLRSVVEVLRCIFNYAVCACLIMCLYMSGDLWFGFSQNWMGFFCWNLLFIAPMIYIINKRITNAYKAMIGDVQIDSERQSKAMWEYLDLPSVKRKAEKRRSEERQA